ncbi:MAG TPA: NusG domain II-containing protein [Eubacteriaceae bacterium]|nr:NusG domain II-containing protein [Eubacteriaceae bacterium]
MKKKDFILIGILLLIAIIVWGMNVLYQQNSAELKMVVSVNGEILEEIPITESTDEEILVETASGTNKIRIHEGQVEIYEADCPDQVCVKTMPASQPGDMIVCLPHQVIVEILPND